MAFRDRLKEARLSKKMTQEQLAEKIGVAKSTLTGYEKGHSEPNLNTISKIMNVLKVDANYLLQDEMSISGSSPIALEYNEIEYIEKYRSLSPVNQEYIQMILDWEFSKSKSQKELQKRLSAYKKALSELHNAKAPSIHIDAPYASGNDIISRTITTHTDI